MNKQPYKSQVWFQVQETPYWGAGGRHTPGACWSASYLRGRRRVTEPCQPLDVCTWLSTHLATTNDHNNKTHLTSNHLLLTRMSWFLFVQLQRPLLKPRMTSVKSVNSLTPLMLSCQHVRALSTRIPAHMKSSSYSFLYRNPIHLLQLTKLFYFNTQILSWLCTASQLST